VLPRIVLAATDDVQDAAVNRHPNRLREVAGASEARVATLRWAASVASGRHYAEARVAGGLIWDDFADFDVSGDFELNLERLL
jgi:hypothetical protein